MARKRTLRPEETAIWRKVASTVTPLRDLPPQAEEAPESEQKNLSPDRETSGSLPATTPTPRTRRPVQEPVDRGGEKRVRRGRVEIDARLDLHGLTQDIALRSLRNFLKMAGREGYRTVLVITGKGNKARDREAEAWDSREEPGVLKRKLPEWLGNPEFRQWVSGYAEAHLRHGGGGAFYVTLRRSRD